MLSLQTPKLNSGPKRRVREMAAHTVPASPARVAMTTQVTYVNTHNRTGINEPARPHQMSHDQQIVCEYKQMLIYGDVDPSKGEIGIT